MLKALNTGVSGMRAEGEAISVVGDNIANVNTVGFKRQRSIFEDMLGRSVIQGTSAKLPGSGVTLSKVQNMFHQGTLSSTGVSTDLALNGEGFFVVNGTVGGVTGDFYSRAGQFTVDNGGLLVNPSGMRVQGFKANPDGTFASGLSDVQIPLNAIPPKITANAKVVANLDSSSTPPTLAWDPLDPTATSNGSTSMTVYDSLGNGHSMDIYFRNNGAGTWEYHVIASGDEVNPAQPGRNVEIGSGTMSFNTSGALDTMTPGVPVTVDFTNAAPGQVINLDFGSQVSVPPGTGLDGLTQFASKTSVDQQSQDGYAAGEFSGVSVTSQGVVEGLYTNGQKIPISQLGVAKFTSNDGLSRASNGLWMQTRESGEPAIGTATAGGRGAISGGALESSNVDLAEEFVDLITHQRAFAANSRTITTADEMLQETLQLKR
ncbi:MAG: flagellar hook protein FlgE [Polyangiaceae bacterium]|nr:flagellar hook protein FlgE [Polyangiaceae bacterium]